MNKLRLREFKNRQERVAKKVTKALRIKEYQIVYYEWLPSAYVDEKSGRVLVEIPYQRYIPDSIVNLGRKKQRINICILFKTYNILDEKIIGNILKRGYKLDINENEVRITYSVNPHSI